MNKKLIALLVVLCLAVLSGCGKDQPKETEVEVTEAVSAPEPTEELPYGLSENPFDDASEAESDSQPPAPVNRPESKPTVTTGAEPTEYEKFQSMSADEQLAYMNSFETIEKYFDWYNAAKAEYEAQIPIIDVGDGPVDMSEFFAETAQ